MLQDLNPPRLKLLEYPAAVDSLPSGSIVANGMGGGWGRPWNYALFGAGFHNRVIAGVETLRLFGAGDGHWRFSEDKVRATGITHFYVEGSAVIDPSPCVEVRRLASLDRNPFNGVAYETPRVLYEIQLCRDAGRAGAR
jgi:hypothetical protein